MTLVAVPCSAADAVALFDAGEAPGDRRLGTVGVGGHPVHLAAHAGTTFVATMDERSVDAIADGGVERVDKGVLGPSHFARVGDDLFVPCTGGDAVAVVDAAARRIRARVGVDPEPHAVAVHGDRVAVGSRVGGSVALLDPDGPAVAETVRIDGVEGGSGARSGARIQGLVSGADALYAVDQAGERVVAVADGSVVAEAGVGADPYEAHVVGGAGAERLLVPGRDDGTVTELSPDLSTATTHAVGGRPTDLAAVDGDVWVVDRDRPALRTLAGERIALPHPGFAACRDPAAPTRLFVTGYDDDAVSAVDVAAGRVEWTADTPARPFEPLAV